MQDPEEDISEYDMPSISTENESYKKKIDEKQPLNNDNTTNPGIDETCRYTFENRGTKSSDSGLEENSFENSLENEIEEISRKGGLMLKGIFSLVQFLKMCEVTKVHSSY